MNSMMILARRLGYYLRSIPRLLTGIRNWPLVVAAFLGLPMSKPFTIQLRQSGLQFRVRNAMDVWIVKEICLDREYERIGTPLQPDWKILDIGAGLGDFSLDVARNCPACVVHAYEPSPESFELLQQNLRLNAITNVTAIPEALNSTGEAVALDVSRAAAVQHSIVGVNKNGAMLVPATTLDTVLDRLGEPCDLLKMDCEGAEYEILLTASDNVIGRIRRIVMEYHDNCTDHAHHELVDHLQAKGFRVACYPSPVQHDLGLLYATAVD
jgi:FkbM family methyltransferase